MCGSRARDLTAQIDDLVAARMRNASVDADVDADGVGLFCRTDGVAEHVLVEHGILAARQEHLRVVAPHDT